MTNHHPDFSLLFDYVAGTLSEPLALSVACHASLCATCHDQLGKLEDLAGTMIDEEGAHLPQSDEGQDAPGLDKILSRLDEPFKDQETGAEAIDFDQETRRALPAVVRDYIPANLDDLPWRHIGGKVSQYNLDLAIDGYKVSLMRFKAGAPMPIHTHKGNEITLVLTGGYTDGGNHFERGDFDAKDPSHKHQPMVDAGEDCLALVVMDAPVVLAGPFSRFLNPFFKL